MAKQICITPGSELDKRRSRFEARFLADGDTPAVAAQKSQNAAVQSAHADRAFKVRRLLDDIQKWDKGMKPMLESVPDKDKASLAFAFLIRNGNHTFNNVLPVEAKVSSVKLLAKSMLSDFETAFFGLRGEPMRAMSRYIKMELGGLDSGNIVAKKAAAAVTDALEYMKAEAKASGIDIRSLTDWKYPQAWDGAKLKDDAFNRFVLALTHEYETPGKMVPLLDENGVPLSGKELNDVVRGMAESIRLGELQGTDIGVMPSAVANKYKAPRIIQFLNHDTRMRFEAEYGIENIYEVVNSHVEGMARNIGVAQTFGGGADTMFNKLHTEVRKTPGVTQKQLDDLDKAYKVVTGYYNRPGNVQFAERMQAFRDVINPAALGSALLSQPTDIVPYTMVSALNGIPAMKAIKNFLVGLATKDTPELRAFCHRLAVETDAVLSMVDSSETMTSSSGVPGKIRKAKDAVFRWNGMQHWARSQERSFQTSILGQLHDVMHLPLDQADEIMGGKLSQFGYTQNEWKIIQSAKVEDLKGAKYVSAANVADHKFDLMDQGVDPELARQMTNSAAQRIIYHVQSDAHLATTRPTQWTKAKMGWWNRPGTTAGEIARTGMMLKGYPIQYATNWTNEFLAAGSWKSRGKAAAAVFAGHVMLGTLSFQLKRLNKGQGLADMSDPAVMASIIMQSGGLGIYGDLIVSSTRENRFGQDFLTTLAGPGVGWANDTVKLTFGNLGQSIRGERANFPSEAIKYVARYTPGVNLPGLGLIANRLMVDQLRLAADPSGTRRSFSAEHRKAKTDYGSNYYWKRGEIVPEFLK